MEKDIIDKPCIYTSADSIFFNLYGEGFINSFSHFNRNVKIHIHIFDPTDTDISKLESLPCDYSIGYIDEQLKLETVENLKYIYQQNTNKKLIAGLKSAFRFRKDQKTLEEKIDKLVHGQNYRSGRFIALKNLWDGKNLVAAYDIDTICQNKIPLDKILPNNAQGCLSIKGRFVTSLIAFKNNSKLIADLGNQLENYMFTEKISFGFMDQNTFIECSKKYQMGHIESKFCSPGKGEDAFVITGKGNKKFNEKFLDKVNLWND